MELNFSIKKITNDVSFIRFSEPSRLDFDDKFNWLGDKCMFFEVNSGLFLYIKTLRNKFHNGIPIKLNSDEYYPSKKTLLQLYDAEYDVDSVHQQYVTVKTKLFLVMDQVIELDKIKEIIYKSSIEILKCWLKNYEDVDIIKPLRITDSRDDDYDNLFLIIRNF